MCEGPCNWGGFGTVDPGFLSLMVRGVFRKDGSFSEVDFELNTTALHQAQTKDFSSGKFDDDGRPISSFPLMSSSQRDEVPLVHSWTPGKMKDHPWICVYLYKGNPPSEASREGIEARPQNRGIQKMEIQFFSCGK